MSLKETLENEKRHESDLQYKMSHQFTYIYLGISGVLVAAFLILLSIDEKRFMGIGIAILILWGILTIAFLTASQPPVPTMHRPSPTTAQEKTFSPAQKPQGR